MELIKLIEFRQQIYANALGKTRDAQTDTLTGSAELLFV